MKLFVALDTGSFERASQLVRELSPYVDGFKIGLEYFTARGKDDTHNIGLIIGSKEKELFLDLKLHDIPNTVEQTARNLASFHPQYITVHAAGGVEMMKRARESIRNRHAQINMVIDREAPKVLGVTVLTSLKSDAKQIQDMFDLVVWAGIDGVVTQGKYANSLKDAGGKDFTVAIPGIRVIKTDMDDHAYSYHLEEALESKADIIILGRSVTDAKEPEKVMEQIYKARNLYDDSE